jgi:hypothetical protein
VLTYYQTATYESESLASQCQSETWDADSAPFIDPGSFDQCNRNSPCELRSAQDALQELRMLRRQRVTPSSPDGRNHPIRASRAICSIAPLETRG